MASLYSIGRTTGGNEMKQTGFPNLATSLAGIRMRSPIGIGAIGLPMINPARLTPQMHADLLLKHVEAGAGFIALPLTAHVPDELLQELEKKAKPFGYSWETSPGPRYMRTEPLGSSSQGLYLRGGPGIPPKRLARRFKRETSKIIEILKQKRLEDIPIIANISGLGAYPETFVVTAKAFEEAGVDMIELNLSCPMPISMDEAVDSYVEKDFPLFFAGFLIGDQPDLTETVAREVVKAVNIPVGVKFSPETGFPRIVELAKRVRDAGCTFVNCGNLAMTIVAPDIYNKGKPKWPFIDGNPFVSIGGDWLRTIVCKQVAAIAKFAPGIDIIATGGLVTAEHIIEALMLGASATQIATGMLYHGRGLVWRNIQFLTRYMKEQGYRSVNEFIGLGQKYIKPGNEIKSKYERVFAKVDSAKCTGCSLCTQHVCLASYMEDGVAKVKVEDCSGCGMCAALCPEGAVTMRGEKLRS